MNHWRMIVADQDPHVRERVRRLAADLGGYSVAVDSGTQALHVLSSGTWLAVVCSCRLRPPNGMRLAGLARRAGVTAPIVLLVDARAEGSVAPQANTSTSLPDLIILPNAWAADDLRAVLLRLLHPSPGRAQTVGPSEVASLARRERTM